MIESYPAAVGMVVMTAALYQWHLEQRALNLQLRRREWDYRDHDKIDPITQLYRAEYWKEQIQKLQQINSKKRRQKRQRRACEKQSRRQNKKATKKKESKG